LGDTTETFDTKTARGKINRLPDFSEIVRGEAVFHKISVMGQIQSGSIERIFCFPNVVWASVSGAFCIVCNTLVSCRHHGSESTQTTTKAYREKERKRCMTYCIHTYVPEVRSNSVKFITSFRTWMFKL